MFIIAGPNGAGKSTLYETRIAPKISAEFVNADRIQRDTLRDPSMSAAYKAAELAEARRRELMSQRKSLVTESTFSHPSKLQLVEDAKKEGYRVIMYHVQVRSPQLSVARVAARVEEGGHNVPEDKIRERFDRNRDIIRQAALKADRAFVYDNSLRNELPRLVLELERGRVVGMAPNMPKWTRELYAPELRNLAPKQPNPAAHSFEQARQLALQKLGASAKTYIGGAPGPNAFSGVILGHTDLHVVQQVGAATAVAHFKNALTSEPAKDECVHIRYPERGQETGLKAVVNKMRERRPPDRER